MVVVIPRPFSLGGSRRRHCCIRRAILDKDVKIPQGTSVGYDLDHDRQSGFQVTEQGVVVIAKAELPETFAVRK